MKTPLIAHVLLTALAAFISASCSSSAPPSPWATRLAPALCTRAESLLVDGDPDGAGLEASRALEQARSQRDTVSEARALFILGLIGRDPEQLEDSLHLLANATEEGLWQIRLTLAQLALDAGYTEAALRHIDPVLEEAADWPAPAQRARAEAIGYHMLAAIRRAEGNRELAARHERWAALQLSVLPDNDLAPLRQAVAQFLGDDCAARALFDEAFQAHARAANLAASLGDQRALLVASLCMSRDLVLLDRLTDAVDHFSRSLDLARGLDDWDSVEDIAMEALHWLDTRGEPWDSQRRRVFRDTLKEVAQRTPQLIDGDSPAPR